jgi:hypothetical protein
VATRAQKSAIRNHRSRLSERGMARFEVLGLESDRDLIRALARPLAEEGSDAARIRASVSQTSWRSTEERQRGGILAALRRSPLVGADLDLTRARERLSWRSIPLFMISPVNDHPNGTPYFRAKGPRPCRVRAD